MPEKVPICSRKAISKGDGHAQPGSCLVFALVILMLGSCSKGEPVVDEEDILTIASSPSTITNFGDSSIITVRLTHSDGRPVPDGARVLLIADGGTIESEVRTVNGQAQTSFFSDASIGTFTIRAQSGQLGLDGSITTTVEVIDRTVEIGGVLLSINPNNITPRGGQIFLTATVFDNQGGPIADKVAVFSSQYGSLASNGALLRSDSQGRVSELLTIGRLPDDVTSIEVTVDVTGVMAVQTLTVTANQNPVAMGSFSPTEPRVGEPVFFDAGTSEDPDGQIVDYQWRFGDGGTGSGETVQHTYQSARTFNAVLTVTDDQGATHAVTVPVTVGDNSPPTADFTFSPPNPRVGRVVTLDAGASSDSDGSIVSYDWTLGNGAVRSGAVVGYAYPSAGDYVVTLTVTDNNGATAFTSQTITVEGNQAPTASFQASTTSAEVGEVINFDGTESSDPDGTIAEYRWNFGSGVEQTGATAAHAYTSSGDFLVVLTVTDNEGAQGFATLSVTVAENNLPTANFSFSPATPLINELITLDASGSMDPDGFIEAYRWGFGDGTFGVGQTVQHRYESASEYIIFLEVEDNRGGKASLSRTVTVVNGGQPNAVLTVSPETVPPEGGQVVLDASGSSDAEDPGGLRYDFTSTPTSGVFIQHNSNSSPAAIGNIGPFPEGTQILFEVEVRDPQNNKGVAAKTVLVTDNSVNVAPQAALAISPTQLNSDGGVVTLDAGATTDGDSEFSDLSFNFSAEIAGDVAVTFNKDGTFLQTVNVAPVEGQTTIDLNARVVFVLVVEDETELIGRTTQTLTFVDGQSNTAPQAVMITTPADSFPQPGPGETVSILMDARNSTDAEEGVPVAYTFEGETSGAGTVVVTPTMSDPRLAVAEVTGVNVDDFVILKLTVQDTPGAQDDVTVILRVTDPN